MATQNHYGMPFRLAVTPRNIQQALDEYGIKFRRRLFDPQTTIWAWMSQIASSDRSCRHAVAEIVARCAAEGRAVSARTGAYSQARERLDIRVIKRLARDLARKLEDECSGYWPIGRPVFSVDGTTLSCPDTISINDRYPKPDTHYAAEGIGFPILRMVLIVSHTTGAIIDLQQSPYRGKNTNEIALFARTWSQLKRGDVVVGDRAYASSLHYYFLPYKGVDIIARKLDRHRIGEQNIITTLSRADYIAQIPKPSHRPRYYLALAYRRAPRSFPVRYTSLKTNGVGGPSRVELLSSFTDGTISKAQLGELYRRRWDIETDIRAFKIDLGADILRCKSADMVEKELWMTVLTNNAVRYLAAKAARRAGAEPRSVSFKGTVQAIRAFAPRFRHTPIGHENETLHAMLDAIAMYEVGNRPGRVEPRANKRRPKKTELLRMSREDARNRCRRGKMR